MKYGIFTGPEVFMVGSIYKFETELNEYYIIKEGNCDLIRKDCLKLISKDEYNIIRNCFNELNKLSNLMSDGTKEYIMQLTGLKKDD